MLEPAVNRQPGFRRRTRRAKQCRREQCCHWLLHLATSGVLRATPSTDKFVCRQKSSILINSVKCMTQLLLVIFLTTCGTHSSSLQSEVGCEALSSDLPSPTFLNQAPHQLFLRLESEVRGRQGTHQVLCQSLQACLKAQYHFQTQVPKLQKAENGDCAQNHCSGAAYLDDRCDCFEP